MSIELKMSICSMFTFTIIFGIVGWYFTKNIWILFMPTLAIIGCFLVLAIVMGFWWWVFY